MAKIPCCVSVSVLVSAIAFGAQTAQQPKFTPPPGEESPDIAKLIDAAREALAAGGKKVSDLLTDSTYMPAHSYPRFRALIRDSARDARTVIVTRDEPGEPLVVKGKIVDANGAPVKDAVIYVYQTSAKGWYSDRAAHISGNAGDVRFARLFGYMKTGADGGYELHTIRPAGYPESTLPQHIHVDITAGTRSLVTEIQFADDPRLTAAERERSRQQGFVIVEVTRQDGGGASATADFVLR